MLLAGLCTACSDDDSDLGRTNSSNGAGGTLATGGTGGQGGNVSAGGFGGTNGTGGQDTRPPEPHVDATLTFVNGIVDAPAVAYCWMPYPGDASGSEQPWPRAAGIDYAAAEAKVTGTALTALLPAQGDVEILAFGGDLTKLNGLSCQAARASTPSGLRQHSLGVLSASALQQPRHLLVVSDGCLGGDTHTDDAETTICGEKYTAPAANASLLAGVLSGIRETDRLPLQFIHASRAMPQASVRLQPGQSGVVSRLVANPLRHGAIAPSPPYTFYSRDDLTPISAAQVMLSVSGGIQELTQPNWSTIFSHSDLTLDDVRDEEGLAFVILGPSPTIGLEGWWNPFRIIAISTQI